MGWRHGLRSGWKVSWSPEWWSAATNQLTAGYREYPSGRKHPPMVLMNGLADTTNSSANCTISAQLKAVGSPTLPLALFAGWVSHPKWGLPWRWPSDKCDLPLSPALSLAPPPELETLVGKDSISPPCWLPPWGCQRASFPNFSPCIWWLQDGACGWDHCLPSLWLTCPQRAAGARAWHGQREPLESKFKKVATT